MKARKKLPAGQKTVPALAPHEALDIKLRQLAQRAQTSFLDFCDLALQAREQKLWERFGYVDELPYWEERVGVKYRSLARGLAVAEALRRLPEPERPAVRETLARLGVHKSAALAKVIGEDGRPWRELMAFAEKATAEAVQSRVSDETGARARGPVSEPGERFFAFLLNQVPPDTAAHVEKVFRALMKAADITNPVAAFLIVVDMAARDLADQGVNVDAP